MSKENEVIEASMAVSQPAEGFIVSNNDSLVVAKDLLRKIKGVRKQIAGYFDPVVKSANATRMGLITRKKEAEKPLVEAESRLKSQMSYYLAKQETLRRAEETRIIQERIKAEEETARQVATEARDLGFQEMAKKIEVKPVEIVPVIIPKKTPVLDGISTRKAWACEVFDLLLLVQAVAAGTVPLAAIKANDVFLGQQARSLKDAMRYPGVRASSRDVVSARS